MAGKAVMAMFRFEEAQLVAELDRLPLQLRVAFAAACAERLLPAYVAFSAQTGRGNPAALRDILTRVWDDLCGNQMTDGEVQANIDTCMGLIPHEDEGPWVMEQAAAEDAGSALAYALRCRQNGQGQEAAWAARCAYEALDHHVINRDDVDMNVPGAEARVLADPLVQAEFGRQRQDLDEALDAGNAEVREAIARLRDRAKTEGATFFGDVALPN